METIEGDVAVIDAKEVEETSNDRLDGEATYELDEDIFVGERAWGSDTKDSVRLVERMVAVGERGVFTSTVAYEGKE